MAFTIQTVPGDLFATLPDIPGGPIQFIAQNNLPNQQWILLPNGLTSIQSLLPVGPGPFANVLGQGIVGEFVNVGLAEHNWFIAPVAGGNTIRLADAVPALFWALDGNNQATLVPLAGAGIFNIVAD